MIDKIAPPFWVIWSVGLAVGTVLDNPVPWIVGSAIVGLIVGFAMWSLAMRNRRRIFNQGAITAEATRTPPLPATGEDVRRAA